MNKTMTIKQTLVIKIKLKDTYNNEDGTDHQGFLLHLRVYRD